MDVAKRIAFIVLFVVCGWFVIKTALAVHVHSNHPNENAAPYQGYFANR